MLVVAMPNCHPLDHSHPHYHLFGHTICLCLCLCLFTIQMLDCRKYWLLRLFENIKHHSVQIIRLRLLYPDVEVGLRVEEEVNRVRQKNPVLLKSIILHYPFSETMSMIERSSVNSNEKERALQHNEHIRCLPRHPRNRPVKLSNPGTITKEQVHQPHHGLPQTSSRHSRLH